MDRRHELECLVSLVCCLAVSPVWPAEVLAPAVIERLRTVLPVGCPLQSLGYVSLQLKVKRGHVAMSHDVVTWLCARNSVKTFELGPKTHMTPSLAQASFFAIKYQRR